MADKGKNTRSKSSGMCKGTGVPVLPVCQDLVDSDVEDGEMSEEEVPRPEPAEVGAMNLAGFQTWCEELQGQVAALQQQSVVAKETIAGLELKVDQSDGEAHEWKKPGLKFQFDVAQKCVVLLRNTLLASSEGKAEKVIELVEKALDMIKERIKMLKIADSSAGGWDTVNAYKAVPVADDSDDDRKLKKAKKIAKQKQASKVVDKRQKGFRPRGRYLSYQHRDSYGGFRSVGSYKNKNPWGSNTFVPDGRGAGPRDVCFRCGVRGHWADACPENSGTQQITSNT